jgi:hypothetical protein
MGAELLQIDTFKIEQLYQYALDLSLTEGNSTSAKKEVACEYIGIVYNLLSMSFKKPKSAKVKMVSPSGDTLLTNIDFSASWRYFLAGLFSVQEDEVHYSFDEKNNGILVVESFQPLSLSVFKRKIDAFFEEVQAKNCTSVYIDLRNNLGGLLRAEEYLFSYINTKQFSLLIQYYYFILFQINY